MYPVHMTWRYFFQKYCSCISSFFKVVCMSMCIWVLEEVKRGIIVSRTGDAGGCVSPALVWVLGTGRQSFAKAIKPLF